ncbi:uncharacterized protein METZ01_LOCUS280362 [marine metagenome]|uniref:DUF3576 domain-containing protein n=1 Tax=marine metagenome TaxID=408172 RepID=A0A382KSI7_9ZZZZ
MKKLTLLLITTAFILTNCGWYKRSDVKDNPVNVKERVQKNIEEGRGIRFGKGSFGGSGTFDFASSNELWRASIEILDFVPFTNASYSGGIIITDWFSGPSKDENEKRMLKITVRFLTNEIRADALKINIHEKICKLNTVNDCNVNKISSNLENEIKLAILKKAALLERNKFNKNSKEYRKKKPQGSRGLSSP